MRKVSFVVVAGALLAAAWTCSSLSPALAADKAAPDNSAAQVRGGDATYVQVAASFVTTGQQHLVAHRFTEAVEDFTAALSFDPELAAARDGLAKAKAGLVRPVAAATERKEARPSDDDLIRTQAGLRVLCNSARSAFDAGDYQKAADEYGRVLAGVRPIAKFADLGDLDAEARRGEQLAAERLKTAAEPERLPAPAPAVAAEQPAAPRETPAAPAAPVPPPASRPKAGTPAAAEKRADPERQYETAFDASMRDLLQNRIPQTEILAKRDIGSRTAPRKDHSTQIISRDAFQTGGVDDARTAIEAKLLKPVSVNFKSEPFAQVIEYIRAAANVNIIVDPAVLPTCRPTDLSLVNMELHNVLEWLLTSQGLDYRVRHGAIYISNSAGLAEKPVLAVHEIADLTIEIKDFDRTSVDDGGLSGPKQETRWNVVSDARDEQKQADDRDRQGERWASFVRRNVAPESWSAEGAVGANTIAYRNGKLVVTQTPEVQEQIRELLASFRKARAIQVAILARFIEISEDFLDDLGISWSGLAGPNGEFGVVSPGTGSSFFRAGETASTEVSLSTLGQQETGGLSLEAGFLKQWQVQAIVTAVRKERKGNILTAPRVTCFNTQRAFLTVTTRRNFVRSYDADGNPVIGQVNDGIVFEVQPFVSADRRYITLELIPQVNIAGAIDEFVTATTTSPLGTDGIDNDGDGLIDEADESVAQQKVQLPQVTTRQIMTTVSVPDGGTLMIGGLARATESEGFATVPFLDRIPIIKYLVRSRRKIDQRNNLVVLVTAYIIQQEEEE